MGTSSWEDVTPPTCASIESLWIQVAPSAPIRTHFTANHVTYVGAHEGCGCGYNSDSLELEGLDTSAEVLPLVGALSEEERERFRAEQRSRERLKVLINRSLIDGPVEVYSCWTGDETTPPDRVEMVDAGWFTARTSPLQERVLFVVRA